jgi:pantoate--beta-alanine ligase
MNIVTCIEDWRRHRVTIRGTIGFVHTMGALHAGHLSLCARSQQENDVTVVAIFINPTQFDRQEDLRAYPRPLIRDEDLLRSQKIDYLLLFDANEIYADQYQIQVSEEKLSTQLEGKFRPQHFTGVLTVVLKFLNLVHPTRAYYGEKDYQQFLLIQKMVQALFLPIQVIPCPTVRAANGLALSSRNERLDDAQQARASLLFSTLAQSKQCHVIAEQLNKLGFRVDYVVEQWGRRLAAVWLDKVRLIDNVSLD